MNVYRDDRQSVTDIMIISIAGVKQQEALSLGSWSHIAESQQVGFKGTTPPAK